MTGSDTVRLFADTGGGSKTFTEKDLSLPGWSSSLGTTYDAPLIVESNSGDDITIDGTSSRIFTTASSLTSGDNPEFCTIRNLTLVNSTSSGDSCLLRDGSYYTFEGCTINGYVRADGDGAALTMIDTSVEESGAPYAVRLRSSPRDNVFIRCNIKCSYTTTTPTAAIHMSDGGSLSAVILENCTVEGGGNSAGRYAVYFSGDMASGHFSARQSTFYNCYAAIGNINSTSVLGSGSVRLENCLFDTYDCMIDDDTGGNTYGSIPPVGHIKTSGCIFSTTSGGAAHAKYGNDSIATAAAWIATDFDDADNPSSEETVTFSSTTFGNASYLKPSSSLTNQSLSVGVYDDIDGTTRLGANDIDAGAYQVTASTAGGGGGSGSSSNTWCSELGGTYN